MLLPRVNWKETALPALARKHHSASSGGTDDLAEPSNSTCSHQKAVLAMVNGAVQCSAECYPSSSRYFIELLLPSTHRPHIHSRLHPHRSPQSSQSPPLSTLDSPSARSCPLVWSVLTWLREALLDIACSLWLILNCEYYLVFARGIVWADTTCSQ